MARFTCPECSARVKLPDSAPRGKRVRCPECGAVFHPDAADSDRPGRVGGESEPRPRMRRKQSGLGVKWVGLLIGGAVAAVLALVLIVVGIVLVLPRGGGGASPGGAGPGSGGGPLGLGIGLGPGGLFGASNVTVENYHKLARGMTVSEAEAVLGPGQKCTINDMFQAADPTNQVAPALKAIPAVQADPTTWRRWQNGGLDIFVGFRKGKSGVERVCFFTFINRLPGGAYETESQEDNPLEDLDATAAAHAKNDQLLKNPRWKTGPAIRAGLVGKWRFTNGGPGGDQIGWDFSANGACVHYGGFGNDSVAPGTYRFTDDSHIETSVSQPDFFPGKPPTQVTENFKVLVDDKELILVYDHPNGPNPTLALSRRP